MLPLRVRERQSHVVRVRARTVVLKPVSGQPSSGQRNDGGYVGPVHEEPVALDDGRGRRPTAAVEIRVAKGARGCPGDVFEPTEHDTPIRSDGELRLCTGSRGRCRQRANVANGLRAASRGYHDGDNRGAENEFLHQLATAIRWGADWLAQALSCGSTRKRNA